MHIRQANRRLQQAYPPRLTIASSLVAALILISSGFSAAPIARADKFSTDDLKTLAAGIAVEDGLDTTKFLATIECESRFDPTAVGDHGTSFGVAQLHYPVQDWGIATSTALQPIAAMEIMGQAWQEGLQHKWSCYRG